MPQPYTGKAIPTPSATTFTGNIGPDTDPVELNQSRATAFGRSRAIPPTGATPPAPGATPPAGAAPTGAVPAPGAAAADTQPAAQGIRGSLGRAMNTAKSYFGAGGSTAANTAESAGADAAAGSRGAGLLGGLRTGASVLSKGAGAAGLGVTAYQGLKGGYDSTPQESQLQSPSGQPGWGGEPNPGSTPGGWGAASRTGGGLLSFLPGANGPAVTASQDDIGGAINAGVRGLGKAFGQDWGVDPTAKNTVDANRMAGNDPFGAPMMSAPNPGAVPNDASAYSGSGEGPTPDSLTNGDGAITRNGSSFSGMNVKARNGASDNLSYIPSSGQTATSGQVMQAAQNADRYGTGAHTLDGTPGAPSSMSSESDHNKNFAGEEAQYHIMDALNHGGIRGPQQAMAIANGFTATNPQNSQSTLEGIRQQGETTRAFAANRNLAAIHAGANAVAARGQDMELAGKQIPLQIAQAMRQRMASYLGGGGAPGQGGDPSLRAGGPAAANGDPNTLPLATLQSGLARAQANGDSLAVDELNKQITARQAQQTTNQQAQDEAQKATQSRLENTFRTTDAKGNSVPDHEAIASYNSALGTTIPAMAADLEKVGTPAALAKAQDLRTRGTAALEPGDHDHLTHNFQLREQLRNTRSHLPGGAEFIDSPNLLDYDQKPGAEGISHQTLTPNRIELRGGSSATPNDLSIKGGSNAVLPDWFRERQTTLTRGLRTQ